MRFSVNEARWVKDTFLVSGVRIHFCFNFMGFLKCFIVDQATVNSVPLTLRIKRIQVKWIEKWIGVCLHCVSSVRSCDQSTALVVGVSFMCLLKYGHGDSSSGSDSGGLSMTTLSLCGHLTTQCNAQCTTQRSSVWWWLPDEWICLHSGQDERKRGWGWSKGVQLH